MNVGTRIKNRRLQIGMSAERLAELVGKSPATIYRYEKGDIAKVDSDALLPIADALATTPAYLMGWEGEEDTPDPRKIPVLGTIPAGIPLEAIEDIIDWEEIPLSWTRGGKEYFALKVHGCSMSPRYEEGDVLILRKQETCESGQDCAVMVNGNDATFKRVKITEDGIMLQAINPDCESYFYTNQQVRNLPVTILGVVVELRRKI